MIEFWLVNDYTNEELRLPVPPSSFYINNLINVMVDDLNEVGEVALIGNRKLSSISFESFFPNKEYNFVQYRGFPSPYDCIELIKKWQVSKRPIIFIVTGTDINMDCVIPQFTYGERDGTGDVYFSIELTEYRKL